MKRCCVHSGGDLQVPFRTSGRLWSFTCRVCAYLLLILGPPAKAVRTLAISVNSSLNESIQSLGYLRILLFPEVSRHADR